MKIYSLIVTALLFYVSYKHFKVYMQNLALLAYLVKNNINPTTQEQLKAVQFVLRKSKIDFFGVVKTWFSI